MDQMKITCVCSQKFNEEEFQKHFSSCQPFKSQFKEFDSKFGELLKSYSEPKERLLIVKFLLKQYINVIDKKLKKYFSNLAQNPPPPAPINIEGNVAPPMGPSGMGNNMKIGNNQPSQVFQNNQNQQNPYAQNQNRSNPYAQNQSNPYAQNQSNPYAQNQNQPNPYAQNQNQPNPYAQNQNQPNPYAQNQNQPNPYAQNQNQPNPYSQNQNQPNPYSQNQNPNPFEQKNNNNDFENDFNSQPIQQDDDNIGTICQRCKVNSDVGYLACVHPICINCFIKYAEKEFYNMKCNICQKEIDDQTKKMILGEAKFSQLESQAIMGMFGGNLVKCPYKDCGEHTH